LRIHNELAYCALFSIKNRASKLIRSYSLKKVELSTELNKIFRVHIKDEN